MSNLLYRLACHALTSVIVILVTFGPGLVSADPQTPIEFTPEEKTYITQAGAIRMCVDPDWAPFERINPQGQHEGIAADLVQIVAQRVGLKLELLAVKDWEESLAASKGKRCQIMSFLNQTPARDTWLIFTDPIFYDPNVIITREEHGFIADLKGLQNESVALPRGTMVEERVRRDFPNLTVMLTSSEPESMQLVSERRADLTIRSLIVAASAIKKEGLFNLKISGQIPEYTNQLRIGVSKDEPVLRAILDKGVKTLTPQEREAISNKHVAVNIQHRIDWTRVYVLLALLAMVTLTALYILRKNRQLQMALAASQEARSALRVSEQRHRLLADNASDVIWTMDLNGRFTYVSPSVERLRGYCVAEVMQQTLEQALTPESAHIAEDGLGLALAAIHAKQPVPDFRAELEQPCKQGGTVWTEVSVSGIQNDRGEFVNLLGVTRDISDRKRADLDLRIAAIAFESQDGMIVTDAQTNILRVNSAFTRITGYTSQEAIGQSPRILRSDRHDANFYAAMWAAVEATGTWHGEIWHQRKNGEIFPEQLTITAIKASSGQVTHYVGALRDITLRKQLEKEVAQLAFFDPLTQLPNRRLFNDRLGQMLSLAKRTKTNMALMFIDLDKFKPINDTHGHEAGDWMLQTVAHRIQACLRTSDTAARVGGDEFLVLLTELQTGGDAPAVAEKIRQSIEEPTNTPSGLMLQVSASIGIAVYPDHALTAPDLLRFGDRAMYLAKNAGGNRVQMCHGTEPI
ncbi:diguanylate cyclase [Rhodoferax sp.]|jgi:diguanylate cyclase (GGDEF)-like protein/PAS domain S-box-containing protein|uniref:diguanylate cyclase domain-containing protein n=1 Tax=Rhodoferax sp. TaxID=50421 RepID=UPI0025EE3F40|nr:diguanylate cyclase [Rhodoferax sp.]